MKPLQRHIILTGAARANKSTVGEALAGLLHRPFIQLENRALMEALSEQESVIAMDDGPIDPLHEEMLRFHTLVHMAALGETNDNRLAHIVVRNEGTPGEMAHRIAARLA
jgi:chloramphenicol 3-O-phosphotransferase